MKMMIMVLLIFFFFSGVSFRQALFFIIVNESIEAVLFFENRAIKNVSLSR